MISNMKLYKKSIDNNSLLLVGELVDEEIVFDEPSKCIHQANYESPDLYELPFYNNDGIVVYFPDCRELLVDDNQFSIGYYDEGRIVFWEQYFKGI